MLSFIGSATAKQNNINSWNTPYDEQTENSKKEKAGTYLASKPTCKSSIKSLENIKNGSAFKNRRKDYCEKIIELYLQKETWSQKDERVLNGLLNSTFIDNYPNEPEVGIWNEKINGFRESNQQQ